MLMLQESFLADFKQVKFKTDEIISFLFIIFLSANAEE